MSENKNPSTSNVALKEWAVTIDALDRGMQVILLRKGGIHEEGRAFNLLHQKFLLFPTFDHQGAELLKSGIRSQLYADVDNPYPDKDVLFSHWAEVIDTITVADQSKLDRISPYHIWADNYAEKRLNWKPRHPLYLFVIRVYRLEEPQSLAYSQEYAGCRSWVNLTTDVALGRLSPVLTDNQFDIMAMHVKNAVIDNN